MKSKKDKIELFFYHILPTALWAYFTVYFAVTAIQNQRWISGVIAVFGVFIIFTHIQQIVRAARVIRTEKPVPETSVTKPPGQGPRIIAKFHAQAWVNDSAIEVDPLGETTADVTDWFLNLSTEERAELKDDSYATDDIRYSENVPAWWSEWPGPFYIEVEESIMAYVGLTETE